MQTIIIWLWFTELTDIDAFVQTFREKLEEKRCEIQEDLEAKKPTFECDVDSIHARYLNSLKCYLARVMCSSSEEYCEKVEKYQEKLDELKCDAVEKFEEEIAKIIEQIECFHEQILDR